MNIQGYLFDKDGTLMKLDSYWFSSVESVVKKTMENTIGDFDSEIYFSLMEIAGFDKNRNVIAESPVVSGTNLQIADLWKDYFNKINIQVSNSFVDDVMQYFSENNTQEPVVPTTPNLKLVMQKIKNSNCRIGVATSDCYDSTKHCLNQLGVLDLVDDIFSADRVKNPKPYSDTMDLACETWGIRPKNIVMVGDSENDMLFAHNSGCKGVYISDKNFLPLGADMCAKNIDVLLSA